MSKRKKGNAAPPGNRRADAGTLPGNRSYSETFQRVIAFKYNPFTEHRMLTIRDDKADRKAPHA